MTVAVSSIESSAQLRQRAQSWLTPGAPAAAARQSEQGAMAVLHQLASSPATAADALALLHELQVYQVELDMQQEEIGRSCGEMGQALADQAALFAHAPVACMTVDAAGLLCDVNRAGAALLGMAHAELPGRPLGMFLAERGAGPWQDLLARADAAAGAVVVAELPLRAAAGQTCNVHARARVQGGRVALVLVDLPPAA